MTVFVAAERREAPSTSSPIYQRLMMFSSFFLPCRFILPWQKLWFSASVLDSPPPLIGGPLFPSLQVHRRPAIPLPSLTDNATLDWLNISLLPFGIPQQIRCSPFSSLSLDLFPAFTPPLTTPPSEDSRDFLSTAVCRLMKSCSSRACPESCAHWQPGVSLFPPTDPSPSISFCVLRITLSFVVVFVLQSQVTSPRSPYV